MATLTVRNVDPELVARLKQIGAANGRSMEAEVRVILAAASSSHAATAPGNLGSRIRDRFAGLGWQESPRPADSPRAVDFDS